MCIISTSKWSPRAWDLSTSQGLLTPRVTQRLLYVCSRSNVGLSLPRHGASRGDNTTASQRRLASLPLIWSFTHPRLQISKIFVRHSSKSVDTYLLLRLGTCAVDAHTSSKFGICVLSAVPAPPYSNRAVCCCDENRWCQAAGNHETLGGKCTM